MHSKSRQDKVNDKKSKLTMEWNTWLDNINGQNDMIPIMQQWKETAMRIIEKEEDMDSQIIKDKISLFQLHFPIPVMAGTEANSRLWFMEQLCKGCMRSSNPVEFCR